MAEGVNVGVLSSALAVSIQQAVSSGQLQLPQVPTSVANQSPISDRSVTDSSRKFTIPAVLPLPYGKHHVLQFP